MHTPRLTPLYIHVRGTQTTPHHHPRPPTTAGTPHTLRGSSTHTTTPPTTSRNPDTLTRGAAPRPRPQHRRPPSRPQAHQNAPPMEAGHLQRSTNDHPKTHPRHGIKRHPREVIHMQHFLYIALLLQGTPSAYIYGAGGMGVGGRPTARRAVFSLKGTQNKTP